jgi:hypothetical protein
MLNPVQIFWSPIGVTMPSLDTKALVDIHDGDTPSIRMPVRMLSIDTRRSRRTRPNRNR